ncbi:calmodulin-beta isoform X2 [Sitodiplosis mosellana]|uniref:calmodulin-beta isoform X2 n=1 Tax=Sitodiplosis mosellana TaxID=263140 RepID=UPI002443AD0E|nr:calmodulin-beta isoform X2 [Sitodiplosis mosellana]
MTRHNNERNAATTDYENNIEQLDAISDASSVMRYACDGSQEISVESPIPCRSAGSSTDGVFFSTSSGRKVMDNRRLISKSQMKEFREAFRLFDKDGDGSITKEELGSVMRSLGQFARTTEITEMLLEIDIDGDGNVSFEEFVDILSNMTDATAESSADQEERELRDAFRVFDKHNRGYITASDLRAVLQCLGEDLDEDEIEDMIKEVDVDGDGRIDFYEFVHALGEPEDSQENEEDDELFSPLPVIKSITANDCDDNLSQ